MNYCMNLTMMNANDTNYNIFIWHEDEYLIENQNYQTTIADLKEFFRQNPDIEKSVRYEMRAMARCESTYEYIANDLEAPIILVKYFQKIWGY